MAYSLSFSKSILVLAFISDKIRRGETEYISTKGYLGIIEYTETNIDRYFQ